MPRVLESKAVDWQLFHLDRGPGQTRNLAADERQQLARMKRQLAELQADILAESVCWEIPENYATGAAPRVWNSE